MMHVLTMKCGCRINVNLKNPKSWLRRVYLRWLHSFDI